MFKTLRHRGWCAANPLPSLRAVVTVFVRRLPFGVLVIMAPLALWQADPADANPVVCLTSLEAPAPSGGGGEVGPPVEVSRCGPVKTTDVLVMERRRAWLDRHANPGDRLYTAHRTLQLDDQQRGFVALLSGKPGHGQAACERGDAGVVGLRLRGTLGKTVAAPATDGRHQSLIERPSEADAPGRSKNR